MRGGAALGLAALLAVPLSARAAPNVITQVVARAEGGRTIVTVHGSETPSFTAYRLEQPSRVVVDLADGTLSSSDGPIDVDTWSVGQIATAQYSDQTSRTARVMIGFKHPSSYDVHAKGHDVIITITPDEPPPAQAAQAKAQAEQAQAESRARAAEARAAQARARADQAQAELARIEQARQAGSTAVAASRTEAQAEQARLARLKAEAEAMAKKRAAEVERLKAAQAEAQKLEAARTARLAEAQAAAERRARASREAQAAEEQRLKAEADEASRLAEAAQAAKKLAVTRSEVEAAESKAKAAAGRAEAELERLDQLRAESARLEQAAEAARNEVSRQRDEGRRLAAEQADQRAQVEHERSEAERIAKQRAQAAAEAAEQARLATLSAGKLAKAEAEARKIADERQRESARLDEIRKQARSLAAERAAELQKIDQERAEHQSLDRQVAEARQELDRISKAANARLAIVPTPSRLAGRSSPSALRARLPVTRLAARVRDVRFDDDGRAERVLIDVGGTPQVTELRSDPSTAVLRIAGAQLPKTLERTLDVSAYHGPIKTISSYVDPGDPGAVRVVASFDGDRAPKLNRSGSVLTWEFARPAQSALRSYPPEQVGAFGASIPLQLAAAEPVARPRPRRRVYAGRRISLDFKDIDIHNVLRLLADVGQVNVVTSDDVKGSVTIRMVDVPWDQALDVILKAKQLGMVREGNLIRVAPEAQLAKEAEEEVARAKAAVELKPIETRLIPLSYADGVKIMPRVQDVLSPRGRVSVDERTNMLIVSDVGQNIALAQDLVRNLDTPTPQVNIEARIVEANTTFLRDIGIQWGGNSINSAATGNPTGIFFPSTVGVAGGATDALTNTQGLQIGAASPNYVVNLPAAVGTGSGGALGLTLGSLNGNININLRLSSLENTGEVRIISAPKITTLDNIEASIEQGVSIPISVVSAAGTNTVFVDAKLNLTVKPHVTNEGSVIMNVSITRNEPDFVNTGARGDPTILKKQARTEMLVRDGDTAVIGGIYTRNAGVSFAKVPWFGDIPVLGWLFKNRRENDDRTELLIFITPRIVNRAMVLRRQ